MNNEIGRNHERASDTAGNPNAEPEALRGMPLPPPLPPPPPPSAGTSASNLASSLHAARVQNTSRGRDAQAYAQFTAEFGPMESTPTPFRVVDSLLKHPARVVYEIAKNGSVRCAAALLAITAVCLLGYGVVMGTFSGGAQWWAVPLKVALGMLFSALICLPSLYIFACLSGGKQSLPEVGGFLLLALALGSILLVGFAPIAWIFSQTTPYQARLRVGVVATT